MYYYKYIGGIVLPNYFVLLFCLFYVKRGGCGGFDLKWVDSIIRGLREPPWKGAVCCFHGNERFDMQGKPTLTDKQMACLLATITALMPLSIDGYLPAIVQISESLKADVHTIEKSLSTFLFGVALGQLAGGAVSDVKGRRVVALSGLAVYVLASLGLVLLQTAEQLLILRGIQALGAGMAAVMAGAVVRDHYDGRQAAQMFALIGIIMMSAPLVAPMLGSVLQMLGGWRAIFGFLMVYALVVCFLVYRFLPHSQHNGKIDKNFISGVLVRYKEVLATKAALGFLFFQAFSFSSMFAFITESPFVYMTLYEVGPHIYAWLFGCNIISMAFFNRLTAYRLKTGKNAEDILKIGVLVQMCANIVLVLMVVVWTLPPLPLMVAAAMLSVGTQGLVAANTQACFMSFFKAQAGSANAILTAGTSLIAAFMGWMTTVLHDGTAGVMVGMMLAATMCGTSLLWLFSRGVWLGKRNEE